MAISRNDVEAGRIDFSDLVDAVAELLAAVHPGIILASEWLAPLGISAYRLAKDINVPANRVTEIINGKRSISAETALRLACYFDTDAQSWVNLQAAYDIAVARRKWNERVRREVSPRAA